MLCGVAPLPASSGITRRHRLNRGGDRQANSALHLAVISRIRIDEKTQAYLAKKTAEGHSKLEIIRCLKRYLAREVFYLMNAPAEDVITVARPRPRTLAVPPSPPTPPARRHGQHARRT